MTESKTEDQKKYCLWKFYAENFWDKQDKETQKCLKCPGDDKYCDAYRPEENK